MGVDDASKHELLRLHDGSWLRKYTVRRWELMCLMRDEGKSWEEMGRTIGRHWTTAKRLWQRGWLERQKKASVCRTCGDHLTRISTYPRYIAPVTKTGLRSHLPHWVLFGGYCKTCDSTSWAWPFVLYTLEVVREPVTPPKGSERFKRINHEIGAPPR